MHENHGVVSIKVSSFKEMPRYWNSFGHGERARNLRHTLKETKSWTPPSFNYPHLYDPVIL